MGKSVKTPKAPAAKKTAEGMSKLKKGIIVAIASFIPVFFFLIIPMVIRNHITTTMNISEELLLALPRRISLLKNGEAPATFKISINRSIFEIPRNMTPVFLDRNSVVFRQLPRQMARTLACASFLKAREIPLSSAGVIGWFMPKNSLEFLQIALNSTYHPIRLLCKADFLTSQGIGGQIFETSWNEKFRGFIFPNTGSTGYFGRIFGIENQEYIEFSYLDEVSNVTLKDWINLAILIKPHGSNLQEELPNSGGGFLAETLAKAFEKGDSQWKVVETALNAFFQKGDPRWVIPIAVVQERRGFIREVIESYRQFAPSLRTDAHLSASWNDILNRAVKQLIKIEMDPHIYLNSIIVICKNIGDFSLKKIKVRISATKGKESKAFDIILFETESLHPGQEKSFQVSPPANLLVDTTTNLSWRVEDIEVIN